MKATKRDKELVYEVLQGLVCPKHRKYLGKHKPKTDCIPCWAIFIAEIADKLHLEIRSAK